MPLLHLILFAIMSYSVSNCILENVEAKESYLRTLLNNCLIYNSSSCVKLYHRLFKYETHLCVCVWMEIMAESKTKLPLRD